MRVHVETRGSGRPVVFTHGIGATRHTFDSVAADLSADHTVITWDLPGHGDSEVFADRAAYERDRVLEDLDDIVAGCHESPILAGHSLGGYLTLAWAVSRPGRAAALAIMATGPGFRDAEKRQAWNDRSERNAHRFGVAPQAAEMNLQHDASVIEGLADIDLPVALLVGDADNAQLIGGMQYLEAKLAHATLDVVAGGDHAMHEGEHAATVAAAIRGLDTRIEAT
ncbi:MAG: alpha/beta fold hydrolase [Acidimicrobiia bacterium]|nr:alpha/beta fold hydrolase [Acidimicrobiia bacterium]